jgi:hypothetical protein
MSSQFAMIHNLATRKSVHVLFALLLSPLEARFVLEKDALSIAPLIALSKNTCCILNDCRGTDN